MKGLLFLIREIGLKLQNTENLFLKDPELNTLENLNLSSPSRSAPLV